MNRMIYREITTVTSTTMCVIRLGSNLFIFTDAAGPRSLSTKLSQLPKEGWGRLVNAWYFYQCV